MTSEVLKFTNNNVGETQRMISAQGSMNAGNTWMKAEDPQENERLSLSQPLISLFIIWFQHLLVFF